jgi:hypothetical protein
LPLGHGVGVRLGRSLGHAVGADQPAAIHRDGFDPKRPAVGQGDLAIGFAVIGAGVAVDVIEKFGVLEQSVEHQIGQQHLAVGPEDRNGPVHAGEGAQRQLGRLIGPGSRIVVVPVCRQHGASNC